MLISACFGATFRLFWSQCLVFFRPFIGAVLLIVLNSVASGQTRIAGKVQDAEGQPVPLANVKILGTNLGSFTNPQGDFEVFGVSPGSYTLVVSHVGFEDVRNEIVVPAGGVRDVVVVMRSLAQMIPGVVVKGAAPVSVGMGVPVRSHTITSEEIKGLPAVSVPALLSSFPGVHVQSDFGIFSSSSVNIRGVGSGQTGTLVLVDGVPVNKSDGGGVNWNIIDRDGIASMEVIKGPVSALFGSNAMGGVINIIMDTPSEGLKTNTSTSYGTYNTFEAKTRIQYRGSGNRKLYWKAHAHRRTSDGYVNVPPEMIIGPDSVVVPVFLKEAFAGGAIGLDLNRQGSLEFSFDFFQDIRGRGTRVYEDLGANTQRDTYRYGLQYRSQVAGWRTMAVLFWQRENYHRLNEYLSDGEYNLYEVDSKRDDFGVRFSADKSVGKLHRLTFGYESRAGRVDASDIYYTSTDIITNSGTMDIHAFFVQHELLTTNKRWSMISGLRFDMASLHEASFNIMYPSYAIEYFADFVFDDIEPVSWHAVNPKWVLAYTPSERSRYYLTAAKGFRAPVLDDLCRSARTMRGLRVANPALRPEHVFHFETGADQKIHRLFEIKGSAYYTSGNDFMHLLSTGDSVNLGYTIAPVYHTANISRVILFGGEAEVTGQVHPSLIVSMNYTYTHPTIDRFVPESDADIDLSGKYLANIPFHRFAMSARGSTKWVNASLIARYTGSRYIRDDNQVDMIYLLKDRFDPSLTLDFKIYRTFNRFRVSIEIDNLTNQQYINNRGYKSPGRMIFLSVGYNTQSLLK